MKLSSFLLIPIIAIAVVVYFIVKNLNLGTASSNALITVLAVALFTALLYISQSGRSEENRGRFKKSGTWGCPIIAANKKLATKFALSQEDVPVERLFSNSTPT